MSVTHVVGVDPGLVHTGVVSLLFIPDDKTVTVQDTVVAGPDGAEVWNAVDNGSVPGIPSHVFIEKYQPRSHLSTDAEMAKGVIEIKRVLDAERIDTQVLLNTGVKKVVRKHLMELLDVWNFSTPTHHQDLRSAARIALLGMLKDEQMNRLIADIVLAKLKGRPWDVRH